jgi:DNA-binding MarR family transcriptional regulator
MNCAFLYSLPPASHVISENTALGGDKRIMECDNLTISVSSCLDALGIFLLSEWDVLAFVHGHGVSLTNAEQISRLLGYEDSVVEGALDRLERSTLIRRSRSSQGVCFYRLSSVTDPGRRRSLAQLIDLSETRDGRLLLRKLLNSLASGSGRKEQSAKVQPMEANHYA